MKKIFAIVIVVALVFTLCSCEKNNNVTNSNYYSEPSFSSNDSDTSSELLELDASENASSNTTSEDNTSSQNTASDNTSNNSQSKTPDNSTANSKPSGNTSSNKTTSNSNNSAPKKENNSNQNESNSAPVEKEAYLTADTSRAPSTDVGSIISNGYIYYTNPDSNFPDGLFRKKISGGVEETVTELCVSSYKVLNGNIYYLHQSNLYKCDTNGNNVKKLYDDIYEFEVAGSWIFAKRRLPNPGIDRVKEELYAISTDGSVAELIKPDVRNDAGSTVEIHGFNRGYCYVSINHIYAVKGQPNTITLSGHTLRLRIDYRNKKLTYKELNTRAEYSYNGYKHYSFDFEQINIINDYVIQGTTKLRAVSLLKKTAADIYESQTLTPKCLLKDYFMYIPSESTEKNYKVVFSNYNGGKKTYTFNWFDKGISSCQLYCQDIHSNSVLLLMYNNDLDEYYLQMVDPSGKVTEIYKKSIKS